MWLDVRMQVGHTHGNFCSELVYPYLPGIFLHQRFARLDIQLQIPFRQFVKMPTSAMVLGKAVSIWEVWWLFCSLLLPVPVAQLQAPDPSWHSLLFYIHQFLWCLEVVGWGGGWECPQRDQSPIKALGATPGHQETSVSFWAPLPSPGYSFTQLCSMDSLLLICAFEQLDFKNKCNFTS